MKTEINGFVDEANHISDFELTYHDSGNLIHFPVFTMQTFPPSQKILIPKYNTVSYSKTEKQNFYSTVAKTISICICHVL